MANVFYDAAKEAFLKGEINVLTDTISVVLVDADGYTFDASHGFLSDISVNDRIATATLANKTATGRVFDADNVTFPAVTGDTAEALVIYKDTGSVATSRLICYIDTGSGLPVTPNGDDININWSDSAAKIFKL